MKTSLVIMAAGIGSRFGGGIKQLAPIGPSGEIIMDYSIHDAIQAGFNKIVFIIRKDIENDFREIIGNRIEKLCAAKNVEVAYAFQNMNDLPEGVTVPEGRAKPWGTGHAILAAKAVINEPFAVINADDYYGKNAYTIVHDALVNGCSGMNFCMAGFILKNTLSDNGGVTRGVCQVNDQMYLTSVVETGDIVKTNVNGIPGAATGDRAIDPESFVSMNFWGLTPDFLPELERGFGEFFKTLTNPLKGEYLLPGFIGQLLEEKKATVRVLETRDTWFGVTYKEDKQAVVDSMRALIESGVYQKDLFSDL